uniref:Uncharacterized protein n=1 Tax=Daphnia galeata TaxID=27404 RepID=A0A8J2RZT2_9CRUS|nr:unnamed protein product [Daphnia galeata]
MANNGFLSSKKSQRSMRFNDEQFKGSYPMIGHPCGSVSTSLSFHLVSTNQVGLSGEEVELVVMVPEHWVDIDFRSFLYPKPDFHINGLYPWDWTLVCFKKRRHPDVTFVEYEVMDVMTECRPVSYEEATLEIRKIANCLQESTAPAVNHSFESWEAPPRPLANSSSCSDLAALDHTRNSISLLQSQDSTPKRNRDGEFIQFDTGSTHSATGSAKRGVGASSRRSVSQNHRAADSSYSVVHNDSGSLNGSRNNTGSLNRVAVSQNRKAVSSNRGRECVSRATDSTRGTTPAIDDDDWKKKMLESMSLTNSILRALLPSSEVENVSALNTALIDIDLSVSLSGVLIEDLGHVSYESTLAKSIMDYIFTRELCCKVQWKGRSGRSKDTRPGIGHLTNMLAIFWRPAQEANPKSPKYSSVSMLPEEFANLIIRSQ